MDKNLPIGVFDSGIGGLTVVKSLLNLLPNERIIYFGDTARCPYGDRDPLEVQAFSFEVLDFLYRQGVKMLVVACNTATAVALPILEKRYGIPVIGVIRPGARAAAQVSRRHVGVIGTQVTVQSGAYEREIKKLLPDASVMSLACPQFVPLVEAGQLQGPVVEQIVADSLKEMFEFGEVDALILGCTHYPLLQEAIGKVVGPRVQLISSAHETAVEVRQTLWQAEQRAENEKPVHVFYTTGSDSNMSESVRTWLGLESDQHRVIAISW